MTREPVLYDPATDTLLVEVRPWPAGSPAEVNGHAGGEDAAEGLVIHDGPDGLPHAYEVEHASKRPAPVAQALARQKAAAPRGSGLSTFFGASAPKIRIVPPNQKEKLVFCILVEPSGATRCYHSGFRFLASAS